jgi:hypothetical protein
VSSPNSLDFYDAELRAHHEHLRAAYGISPGDEVDLRGPYSNSWQTLVPELHRLIRDVGLC